MNHKELINSDSNYYKGSLVIFTDLLMKKWLKNCHNNGFDIQGMHESIHLRGIP